MAFMSDQSGAGKKTYGYPRAQTQTHITMLGSRTHMKYKHANAHAHAYVFINITH